MLANYDEAQAFLEALDTDKFKNHHFESIRELAG